MSADAHKRNVDSTSSPRPSRISIVIGTLGGGGAERVALMIAEHWQQAQHNVTIVTLSDSAADAYPLPPHVRRVGLHDRSGRLGRLFARLVRVRELRKILLATRPDIVVSLIAIANLHTLLATHGLHVPVIVCEENEPKASSLSLHWRVLRRLIYPRASRVVVRTQAVQPWADRMARRGRAVVIPNALTIHPLARQRPRTAERHRILAMGRLVPQKGFDLLIEAFSSVAASHSDWDLVIRGEGAQRHTLEALVDRRHLEDRVFLPGFSRHPAEEYAAADLFVLSSRYEGFAIVLLEAMAAGLPCIAFDCPNGPAEIITDQVDGILVPAGDADSLADVMRRLMDSPNERDRLGQAALDARERFSRKRVMLHWDTLLSDVLSP